jgi:UDP-N-acetylmuramate--alanine ligase
LREMERIHFVGIGGIGMSAIAAVLREQGCSVSGSDIRATEVTQRLEARGIQVHIGHNASYVNGATTVVYSTAIQPSNPEILEARRQGIPVLHRSEMLRRLMRGRKGIAVAGTHGKTTTSSMIARVLEHAGLDPTIVIGGDLYDIGCNGKLGTGEHIVVEACESDESFLNLEPSSEVITNIEADHLDVHGSLAHIVESFRKFMAMAPAEGFLVACWDSPTLREIAGEMGRRPTSYGLNSGADYTASGIEACERMTSFSATYQGESLGRFRLCLPGRQNVLNALACIAASRAAGLELEQIREALAQFRGVKRRFEILGVVDGVMVVDDYAHHPTEIRATLAAAEAGWRRRKIAVFQPHLYSRTKLLLAEFGAAFDAADELIVTDIYAARELPIEGVHSGLLVDEVRRRDPAKPVTLISEKAEIVRHLRERVRPGDMVLVLGAGDIREVGETLVREAHSDVG